MAHYSLHPSSAPSSISADSSLSSLTPSQEKVLAIVGVFSSLLSIAGSLTIAVKVMGKAFKRTPYDRLLLGLSVCDIIASTTLALGPFLIPSSSPSQRVWAIGNDATCTVIGWFFQFSFSAVMYNGMLSYYHLLTVRFGVKRQEFARKYEVWMHVIVWVWFLGTATYGASIGLYHELELGFGCWANDFPENCEIIDISTCTSHYYGWIMAAAPCIFVLLSLIGNNIAIVLFVRRILAPNRVDQSEGAQLKITQIREVATQGYLYVATFMATYWATFVIRVMESVGYTYEHEADLFVFLLFMVMFQPLQGFFNVIVYNKPNYLRVRSAYPGLSTFQVICMACLQQDIPRLSTSTKSKTAMNASKRVNAEMGNREESKECIVPDPNSPASKGSQEAKVVGELYEGFPHKSSATKPFVSRFPRLGRTNTPKIREGSSVSPASMPNALQPAPHFNGAAASLDANHNAPFVARFNPRSHSNLFELELPGVNEAVTVDTSRDGLINVTVVPSKRRSRSSCRTPSGASTDSAINVAEASTRLSSSTNLTARIRNAAMHLREYYTTEEEDDDDEVAVAPIDKLEGGDVAGDVVALPPSVPDSIIQLLSGRSASLILPDLEGEIPRDFQASSCRITMDGSLASTSKSSLDAFLDPSFRSENGSSTEGERVTHETGSPSADL